MLSRLNKIPDKDNTLSFNRKGGIVVGVFGNKYLTKTLNVIKSNPIVEAAGLDLCTMVLPRTYEDSKQNPDYALETFCREVSPIPFNPFGPTIVSAIMLAGMGLKEVTAGEGTIKGLHKIWQESGGDRYPDPEAKAEQFKIAKKYADNLLSKVEGADQLTKKQKNSFTTRMAKAIIGDYDEKKTANLEKALNRRFVKITGMEENLSIKLGPNESLTTDAHSLFKDAMYVPKKVFTKHTPGAALGNNLNKLFKFVRTKSALAVGLSVAGTVTMPFLNNAFTKARTGSSAYCAYQDFRSIKTEPEKEKKNNWKLWRDKALGVLGIGLIAAWSMEGFKKGGFIRGGGLADFKKMFSNLNPEKNIIKRIYEHGIKNRLADLGNKITLKGANPDRNIIKFIYATTIASRFIFARDEQEVKVTAIRDYTGFLNWLVFGGIVSNGIARVLDKRLVNAKGIQKTYGEVKSMVEHMGLSKADKAKEMAKAMAKHNAATLGGLIFSSAMLGFAMPRLNNYLTNRARTKQLEQQNKRNVTLHMAGQNAVKNIDTNFLYADFYTRRKKLRA